MRCPFHCIIKKKTVRCKGFVYVSFKKKVNKTKRLRLQFFRINMDFDFLTLKPGIQPKRQTLDIEIKTNRRPKLGKKQQSRC